MLALFRKKKAEGWMAVVPGGGRIDLAHVLQPGGGRPEIRLLESFQIESDVPEALARLRSARKLKSYHCTTVLPNGRYLLLQLDSPAGVPAEERRQALRWRLKDMVDFPVDRASIDILDIPLEGHGGGRPGSVFVAAASADAVGAQMRLFDGAKLSLEVIDLPEVAQRNVASLFEEPNRGLAFLALDEGGGLLTLTYKGELFACRRIDISARQLADGDGERRRQLIERLALELQRSLDTFDRQFGFISIARLLVACAPAVEELQPGLVESLYLPVQLMDLAQVADFPAVPELRSQECQARSLTAIGAALRERP